MEILIVADDLIGAASAGVRFLGQGRYRVELAYPGREFSGAPRSGLALSTETRAADKITAVRAMGRVARLVADLKPKMIFKKIDLCLRGQVGLELAALAENLDLRGALVVPVCPARQTSPGGLPCENGRHCLVGRPGSEGGRLPINPFPGLGLVTILSRGHNLPVISLPLALIRQGATAVGAEINHCLLGQTRVIVAAEAETEADLATLALAGQSFKDRLLLAGSLPLAEALGRLAATGLPGGQPDYVPSRPLIFFGHPLTSNSREQFDFLEQSGLTWSHRPTAEMLSGPPGPASPAPSPGRDLAVIQPRLPQTGHSSGRPQPLTAAFARYAADLVEQSRPGTIFVSGGDTPQAILEALNLERVMIRGEILPGVILLESERLGILLQTGGFGDKTLLALIYGCL